MSSFVTIVGDPHLTNKSIDKIDKLCNMVEDLKHPVVWLGDMLDTKEVIRGKCLNYWFKYFSKSPLDHVILVGNHDWFNLDCNDHSLRVLKSLDNVTIVDELSNIGSNSKGKPIYAIPYIHDQKKLKKILSGLEKDSTLFGHLELKGFDFGNGRICEEGLTKRSFNKFNQVFSGHFHKKQKDGNFYYIGAPFSHSFGESNQDKQIAVLDTKTDAIEFIDTKLPRHITIDFDCDESFKVSGKDMHHSFPLDVAEAPENYYRVILNGTQENINRFPKEMYSHNNDCKISIKFIERATDNVVNSVNIDDTLSNEAQFKKWAKEIKGLNDKTIELGLQILGGVNG